MFIFDVPSYRYFRPIRHALTATFGFVIPELRVRVL